MKKALVHRPFVVYWNNIPAPYMIERFNALADRDPFEFEAWFNERSEEGRSWKIDESSWRFRYRYLPKTSVGGAVLHWPVPVLGRRPDVLVSLYAEPVFIVGWALAKVRGARTAFWCQVTHDLWVRRTRLKENLKRLLLPRADATLGAGEDGRCYAMRYGMAPERAWILRHSIDVEHFVASRRHAIHARPASRSALNISGTTFIYVGRLWWGKGLEYLFRAFARVQNEAEADVSLLIVGDGAEEARLRRLSRDLGLRNVVFAGFREKAELPVLLAASDVFVFPTLGDPYGLVVDEAMASALPIISTRAAGEITDRVKEGQNGFLVPAADVGSLADRMLTLASHQRMRQEMGAASAQLIDGHTPETWASDFEAIVDRLLAGDR